MWYKSLSAISHFSSYVGLATWLRARKFLYLIFGRKLNDLPYCPDFDSSAKGRFAQGNIAKTNVWLMGGKIGQSPKME